MVRVGCDRRVCPSRTMASPVTQVTGQSRPSRPGGASPGYFGVLSYTGTFTITATTDPDHFPRIGKLTGPFPPDSI
jgi:hypothetical protein